MSGDIRETLETQFDELNKLYSDHLHAVQDLQEVLISDILPGLADERGWDEDEINYAREWLTDTESVFRMLKRHKFTTSIAMETLRMTLPWRLNTLPPWSARSPSPYLRCLPVDARDPFGRPIIIIQLSGLWSTGEDLKVSIYHNIELMRLHLVRLNEREPGACPILQYVALLDIRGLAFNGQSVQLLSWFVHEVIPKFPGLLASALVLNYSWAQVGLWNLAKRLLPASALQKVFFPTNEELKALLTLAVLPKDWDGDLPCVADIENILQDYALPSPLYSPLSPMPDAESTPPQGATTSAPPNILSSTSLLNPFFGYPVSYTETDLSASTPNLRHGRRRKRDLVYTLLRLWWSRWKNHIRFFLFLLFLVFATWKRRRISTLLRIPRLGKPLGLLLH
ncbi:hypothetical protein BDY19DRAFT_1010025 [Irpex rosettiformis]|uniref:Uncharacterized protein n=1 Tax=Irpex rosettiformis TaxID=378272 RepID=A0ACB8U1I0_9APHY|nr:hypothetical protein BDY19DRAFT_1010025 [Irpex rosettiformis]